MLTIVWMIAAIISLWPHDQVLALIGIAVFAGRILWATFKVVVHGED